MRRNGGGKVTFLSGTRTETAMDTDRHDEERGRPASFDPVSGEVHGSGSGAGGGNPGEDHDTDPMAGSGAEPEGGPRPASGGADRPIDKDENI